MSVLPQTPTFPQSGGFGAKNETVLNPLFYRNLPTGKAPTILDELKQAEDKPDVPEEKVEPVKKPARQETKLVQDSFDNPKPDEVPVDPSATEAATDPESAANIVADLKESKIPEAVGENTPAAPQGSDW